MSTILSFKKDSKKGILSEKFPEAWLDAAMAAYDAHPNSIKLTNKQVLKGLRIDKEDILNLVKTPGFNGIYLRFVVEPIKNEITIVAGALVPGGTDGQCDRNNLYDYCEPCPDKCAIFV